MEIHENPRVRQDLDFVPIQDGRDTLVLIRDPLNLVDEGKALPVPLYEIMASLDGTKTIRDIQMVLMRQRGGVLVGTDEVEQLLVHLDRSFLLESERYSRAREEIVSRFAEKTVRPPYLSGRSYPGDAPALRKALDDILQRRPPLSGPKKEITALIAPHIDLSAGAEVYASAYQCLKDATPSRVILLGVGHQMMEDIFCLTEKHFETPLGTVKTDRPSVRRLKDAAASIIAGDDFAHKSEHSLEFQLLFLQHLLREDSFKIVPILCGPVSPSLPAYTRKAYLQKAGPFLKALSEIAHNPDGDALIVAGVDFSHIGPKFGHDTPAPSLQSQSENHDQRLLRALTEGNPEEFWEESAAVKDRFNVCGFSAMACLLEILPPCEGKVLNHRFGHETATRSAVSFAAVIFTKRPP